jgi:alkanesulfonate monooxygenase SsuD/methylene tetrahydromethanopterin reductase-like flavin-dependent oxidoreductase (luciferase family)
MPYASLDLSLVDKYETTWLHLPNDAYDPQEGANLYNRYLDELEAAEELGYDGVCINEHHGTAYGLMPSPSIIAAALARRTKHIKIGIIGLAALLRNNPVTVAEELAMLDNITRGRLICSLLRGIGHEYLLWQVNPTYSFEMHRESTDLIVRAWTETGPFAFEGKHFHLPYVNIWPRPYQKPHPPIWIPSNGSRETIEYAASDPKFTYLQAYTSHKSRAGSYRLYESLAKQNGWTPTLDHKGWLGMIYVAKTDEVALRESKPHIESFFNRYINKPVELSFPPGFTSIQSLREIRERNRYIQSGGQKAEKLIEDGVFICGSVETVRRQLGVLIDELGVGHVMGNLQFGTLPHDLTMKNMTLFAEHIIPYFKGRRAAAE